MRHPSTSPVLLVPGCLPYIKFINLLEQNFAGPNPKSVCVECWELITRPQVKLHKDQGHEIVTPKHCKDEKTFLALCYKNDRFTPINELNHLHRLKDDS